MIHEKQEDVPVSSLVTDQYLHRLVINYIWNTNKQKEGPELCPLLVFQGTSTKYSPQRVGLTHIMEHEDVIQIVKK